MSCVTFANWDLLQVWGLHEAAWAAAGRTDSLAEKRRALVFMAWVALRFVHQTPKSYASHITINRRAGVRVLLRSARELRLHMLADGMTESQVATLLLASQRGGRVPAASTDLLRNGLVRRGRITFRGRYVLAIRYALDKRRSGGIWATA